MQDFSALIEPSLIALLSWWFGTGIILLLVRLPKEQFSAARLGWTLISIPAMYFSYKSMLETTNANAYTGFISTIVLWGWHELAFLTGWISGPRKVALERDLNIWNRFKQSVDVIWHHELALFLNLLLLVIVQIGHPNHTAMCTFALLWLMRLSSKLNLFFGVPQVGEQYLPAHLIYMGSYFRKKPVGIFFYTTMSLSISAWLYLIWQAHEGLVTITSHWVLLASLLGLAIIEHIIMMVPLSLERVWGWALKSDVTHTKGVSSAFNPANSNPLSTTHRSASIKLTQVFEDPIITPIARPGLVAGSVMDTK
jgi:putative photosynthetic complex assembly protein 2